MPMQATRDELELKQHVTSTLARQGVLGKIKAQLRAAVFHAMHDHEPDEELAFAAKRLEAFKREGELALEIVQDFLAFFQLEHSLAVLRTEASVVGEADKRLADALEALGLQSQDKSPLLIQLLLQQQQPKATPSSTATRESSSLDDRETSERSSGYFSRLSGRDEAARTAKVDEQEFEVAPLEKLSSARLASDTGTGRFDAETRGSSERLDEGRSIAASATMERDQSVSSIKESVETREDDDGEGEAKDESVASASELDESIAEDQSTSLNYSQDYESASRDDTPDVDDHRRTSAPSGAAAERSGEAPPADLGERHDSNHDDEQEQHDDDDGDRESDESLSRAAALAPPPVPTLLSPLPSLSAPRSRAIDAHHDDDDFDEEREAARLSSLDAKLKAMEAEDETGTLQQLKASLQMELQHDDESLMQKRDASAAAERDVASHDHDDDHDGYGSDFEEEEVISEVLDDEEIESVADLSVNDDDDSVALSTHKPLLSGSASATNKDEDEEHRKPELQDRAVADESALNSYDYVEDVEKDW